MMQHHWRPPRHVEHHDATDIKKNKLFVFFRIVFFIIGKWESPQEPQAVSKQKIIMNNKQDGRPNTYIKQ